MSGSSTIPPQDRETLRLVAPRAKPSFWSRRAQLERMRKQGVVPVGAKPATSNGEDTIANKDAHQHDSDEDMARSSLDDEFMNRCSSESILGRQSQDDTNYNAQPQSQNKAKLEVLRDMMQVLSEKVDAKSEKIKILSEKMSVLSEKEAVLTEKMGILSKILDTVA